MPKPVENCPICASTRIRRQWTARNAQNTEWKYDTCIDCGLIFLNPPPDEKQLDTYYDDTYYGPGHQRFKTNVEGSILAFRKARARRAMRLMPEGGDVLDVGCGRGIFLEILARKGYRSLGTERSEPAARDANKRVKVMVGNVEEIGLPDESFDLVTFWQVLEHLNDPKVAIAETRRILKPGGKMLIQVPNPSSWQARATGPHWFHLDPPRHLYLFPIKCLDQMCAEVGFARESMTTLSFEYSPFGALQSFWNILGMRRDLFYVMLMAADKSDVLPSASKRAALFAASAVAAPFATLFSLTEWAAGSGGVIEAVYRK